MTHDILLVSRKPGEHSALIDRIERAGARVIARSSLDGAMLLFEDGGNSTAAIIFDCCSLEQWDHGKLGELSLRRPEMLQLLFRAHVSEGSKETDSEVFARHAGIHLFDMPLAHPDSYQLIWKTLEGWLGQTSGAAIPPDSLTALRGVHSARDLVSVDPGADSRMGQEDPSAYSEAFLRRVAAADVPVLLHGETGAGKEVMARALWGYSARANKPFLKLNCAALPSELIESELFGYEKGAFTGATIDKIGKFEMAQNGTILLDEIGDMDVRLQAKLLQVLQDGEVQPLGSSRIVKVNVRVMAATHRDLLSAIEQGSFREDLYYRLSVINITIPPLRERPGEILPLARTLLLRHLPEGMRAPMISPALERAMLGYDWPGNVRELENVMRRLLVYQDGELLARELMPGSARMDDPRNQNSRNQKLRNQDLRNQDVHMARPEASGGGGAQIPAFPHISSIDSLAQAAREAEAKLLLGALESSRWNRRQAALSLNIEYKSFLYKLQKHGIVEIKAKRKAGSVE